MATSWVYTPIWSTGDAFSVHGRVIETVVSSAIFVPQFDSWMRLSSLQSIPSLVLVPPNRLKLIFRLANATLSLAFPSLAFHRLIRDSPSDSASFPHSDTILFAGFRDAFSRQQPEPKSQTYKLALQFPSTTHLFQFVEFAIRSGARDGPRLLQDLALFLKPSRNLQANLDGNPVSRTQERHLATMPYSTSMTVQRTGPSQPEVSAPESRNLEVGLNEPALKKRRPEATLCLFPTTECPSIPAASSISLDSGGGCLGSHNDNSLPRQLYCQGHVATEVEDELDNADGLDPSPLRISNRPQEQLLLQPECELDPSAMEVTDTHAPKDLPIDDLRSELLDCLLDPSFHQLVARVEDLLVEIENPANIDLASVAEFLRK